MAYLSKDTIIHALKGLANASPKVSNNFSAIQYFVAVDRFFKTYNKECDSSLQSEKKEFYKFVSEVISLDDDNYLSSFKKLYVGSKKVSQTVGSNFFAGSSVDQSKKAANIPYKYPMCEEGLFVAINGKVKRDVALYDNLKYYLSSEDEKLSLALWLIRKNEIKEKNFEGIKQTLQGLYSTELCNLLFAGFIGSTNLLFKDNTPISFSDTVPNIIVDDISSIIDISDKQKEETHCQKIPMMQLSSNSPLQRIYYGAPGTGKSNEIKELTGEGKDGIKFSKNFTYRTTFHPDSDYASFVGAYKPIWDDKKEKIVYTFRPQTFLKAYIAAWLYPDENVALVIEEINRGNCAQIFGDIFQLLDRENTGGKCGLSKYPIEADIDMQGFLYSLFHNEKGETLISDKDNTIDSYYKAHYDNAFDKIAKGEILSLPKNLSILATMNTSDQSLFPMDSAFKRRWEWIYQAIIEGIDKEGNKLDWKINLDGCEPIDWWKFLQRINKVIADLTTSEDKQLGYFFCMPDGDGGKTISAERFVGKVIFYLWNDVFKDYAFEPDCCKDKDSHEVLYAQFYEENGKTPNIEVLVRFFNSLKDLDGKTDNLAIPKEKQETKTEDKPAEE